MDEQDRGNFEPLNADQPPAPATPATPSTADDYAHESRQAGNWAPPPPPTAVHPAMDEDGGHRNLIISVVALIILAIIAGGIYWFSLRHKPSTPTASKTNTSASQQPAASQIDTTTKSYNSPNFNLAFSYPSDWTINDNGNGIMTAKSPVLRLTNAAGQSQQGTIVLTLRTKGSALPEFNKGNATATRDSVKVSYTQPTQNQRANTYLSFLQYAATTTHGALDGVYITGNLGYQKGQNIPATDVSQLDPIISITFTDASGKAMSITDSSWNDTNLSGPLVKMLESFAIN